MLFQSILGYATKCALKLPVAPPNLAEYGIAFSWANCASKRSTYTRISLPKRVGDAGWPCVCASIEMFFHSSALDFRFSIRSFRAGKYVFSIASLNECGIEVLLMSWDVRPKCINSLWSARPNLSNSSLMKYSTAFTSWFVMLSISLIRWASSCLKFS